MPLRFVWAILIVFAAGCAAQTPPEQEPSFTPFPTPIRPTYTVQRGDVVRRATFEGRIVPRVSTELFFDRDGRVGSVYVAPGDRVQAGQLLADLTALNDLQEQWTRVSEEIRLQEEAVNTVIRRAEIDLEVAQLTLDLYRSQGRSSFEIRIQELEVERAQIALDEVSADVSLTIDRSRLKELETAMAEAQLFSSVDGTVIAAVDPGQSVRSTTTAFAIGDINRMEVRANADSALIKDLVEDMPVRIVLDAQPDNIRTFDASIRQLPYPYGSRSSDSNDTSVRIDVDVSPAEGGYQIGDRVQVEIILGQKLDTLWLPPEAIRTAGGRSFVFVQTDTGSRQVNISPGVQTFDRVEIIEGLTEGQVVIGP